MCGALNESLEENMDGYQVRFIDKILDNVHGFIEFTAVEKEIIELPIFK